MGSVIVVYRIMVEDMEHFDSVKKALEGIKPDRLEEEPIAFGLKALKLTKVIPDAGGEVDALENQIARISGIRDFENIATSRSL